MEKKYINNSYDVENEKDYVEEKNRLWVKIVCFIIDVALLVLLGYMFYTLKS